MVGYVIVGVVCLLIGVVAGVGILAICSMGNFEEDDIVENRKCGNTQKY